MNQMPHHGESTGNDAALYMALELSASRWQLAFAVGLAMPSRRRTIAAGDEAALQQEIAAARRRFGLPATAAVRSCYEAGRDGFWIHRLLERVSVRNVVVDSASIEVNRRQRRAKTDRLDAEALLRRLIRYWLGERDQWKVVHVPSLAVEDARHAERSLAMLTAERTRYRNRLHGVLATHGVRLPLKGDVATRVTTVMTPNGHGLPPGVIARVQLTWRLLQAIEHELAVARAAHATQARAAATPAAARTRRLAQLKGIRVYSAAVLATEVFARDLRNRREVGALSGLVPVPYQSGAAGHDQGISRAGLKAVRRLLVEVAWSWVRWQPGSALTRWYRARFGTGGPRARRIGIVALARKLLIALWRYSEQGLVPAGAVLRG
jgi:transposase